MTLPAYERLGSFYLGREYDLSTRQRRPDLLLYDSKDLVTHAVCVGMTGSGKTGLCIALLEEAAIDSVPSIIIDPKGDLANLLLTFPTLDAAEFEPWVNEEEARKQGLDRAAFARKQAERWAAGLKEWDQDAERIARLRSAAEFTVYTPGSSAGRAVSVLKSFAAPPPAIRDEPELLRERIASTATSLLGLMGIAADPITSREHILLATILHGAWSEAKNLDLPQLIQSIQSPGFTRLGVMELETVFPAKDRFALAMALNNLIASPGFGAWMEGESLDVGALLHSPAGKPRVSIFSIAHLSDAERMFFVSILLNETLAWVRTQPGTTSLRALLYMDEIAGYFPPVANPPSKQPLLTLMKQARAFGFGVVLATQNPVDLDYKGLSNAGTWFIGRLQTERDKARVLDGLEGAATGAGAAFNRADADAALSSLSQRVFLMNNIHEDHPVVFESRWALSYLRGPMTRPEIKRLQAPLPVAAAAAPTPAAVPIATSTLARPVLPADVPQYFLPLRSAARSIVYRPMLLGSAKVQYSDAKAEVDAEVAECFLAPFQSGPVAVDWDAAEPTELTEDTLERAPAEGASFESLPPDAGKAKSYEAWKKALSDALFRTHRLELFRCAALGLTSNHGEREREFKARLQQATREARDAAVEKLRAKYAPKLAALEDRARRADQAVEVQKAQASQSKVSSALSFGAAILGAFTGRKMVSAGNIGRAASAMRGAGRTMKESSDVGRAEENSAAIRAQREALARQFEEEVAELSARLDAEGSEIETLSLKPKKTGINVRAVVLVWAPFPADSPNTPAW